MKKLSLLVALILCVTISGVYATWSYSRNVVDSKQASATVVVTGTQSSTKGVISIESAPKRIIVDDTNNDHVAELFFGDIDDNSQKTAGTDQLGTISVKFTPAASGVDAEVAASGIYMAWDLTASNLGAFDIDGDGTDDAIFVITQAHGHFNGGNRAKEASINIADYIKLNVIGENPGTPIKLDTYAKYQAFENAIKSITFTLTVSEWDGVAHNG